MMASSDSPLVRSVSTKSRCVGVSSVSSSRPVMPMTPFIGVRISWLMLARNSDLVRLPASAISLASSRRFSYSRRSVMSRAARV